MEFWGQEEYGVYAAEDPPTRRSAHFLRIKTGIALAFFDLCALLSAVLIVTFVSERSNILAQFTPYLLVAAACYFICALYGRAYNHEVIERISKGLNRSFAAAIAAITTLILILTFSRNLGTDWLPYVAIVSGCGIIALIFERLVFDRLVSCRVRTVLFDRVLILDGITMLSPAGFRVIDAPARAIQPDANDPMMRHWAALFLQDADRVIVACQPEKYRQWAKFLNGSNVRVEIIMPELNELGVVSISNQGSNTTIGVSQGRLSRKHRAIKRAFDILAVVLLAIPALPLIAIGALLIKLEDGGSIFFRQLRVGRGNRLFEVYKLRSMSQSPKRVISAVGSSNTPKKITKIGQYLRALSIDELPQLYNVLCGQMSLVGPRPHALESHAADKLFWEVDEKYWHRHAIKPGITGLAQVRGFRGATVHQSDLSNRLHCDLEYLQGWSIWRDLAIIFATFRVLIHKNAY